jgi:hypothetical protein
MLNKKTAHSKMATPTQKKTPQPIHERPPIHTRVVPNEGAFRKNGF